MKKIKSKTKIIWPVKSYVKMTYRRKLALAFALIALLPFAIVGSALALQYYGSIEREVDAQASEQLGDIVRKFDDFALSVLTKIEFIKFSPVIGRILTKDYTGRDNDMVEDYNEARYFIRTINPNAAGNEEQFQVYIHAYNPTIREGGIVKASRLSESGEVFDGSETGVSRSIHERLSDGAVWRFEASEDGDPLSRGTMYVYSQIRGMESEVGVIEIRISMRLILKGLPALSEPYSCLAFIDENEEGHSVFPEGADVSELCSVYLKTGKAEGYRPIAARLRDIYGSLALFTDQSYIAYRTRPYIITIALVAALFILLMIFLIQGVSYLLTKRLSSLIAESGAGSASGLKDEFAIIALKLQEQMSELKSNYEKEKKLEIELLQASIDPHFLYNTLSSIKWAFLNDELTKVIDRMVKYYRIALNRGGLLYPVPSEFEMLSQYLEIQKFAYNKSFSYSVKVLGDADRCEIMKNLLQPIVENAFIHAMNQMESGGVIAITARREGRLLVASVEDNGPGVSPEKLKQINESLKSGASGGYGLYSVNARIRVYYGEEYGIEIKNLGQGCIATVTIPARQGA
ncbi:MAG: histidine kinase [Clostridiales bacterium]|jgi:signal transduction histidine kinase|nr:histidine kinase [Clostridiales bacterium]MDR2750918.1 histidine kinase [Clostridiales bacterium]